MMPRAEKQIPSRARKGEGASGSIRELHRPCCSGLRKRAGQVRVYLMNLSVAGMRQEAGKENGL